MKNRILGIFVTILTLVMFSVAIMAKSPNKVPVAAFVDGMVPNFDNMIMIENDDITHFQNIVLEGPLSIYVDDDPTPIPVSYINDPCSILFNPKVGENGMSLMEFNEVWTLEGGTFVGTSHVKIDGFLFSPFLFDQPFTHMTAHIVLHGTGDYEGQVLNLKMDWYTADPSTYGYFGTWLKS